MLVYKPWTFLTVCLRIDGSVQAILRIIQVFVKEMISIFFHR